MEIKLADYAGFCFGVKRAVDTVSAQIETGKKIYTYGPIVHNDEVVNELCERGVSVIEDEQALAAMPSVKDSEEIIIIRAHGVPERIQTSIQEKGYTCVDATCPFVKKIHRIVKEKTEEGYKILIVGNSKHPEVEGIVGWSPKGAIVVEKPEDLDDLPFSEGEKICVVAQTTFNLKKFQYLVEILNKKSYNVNVANTICSATEERQCSARKLAGEVDAMIVIGGRHSSNSAKLYEICKEECANTYFIQTLDDLRLEKLPKAIRLVGVTAGASTPNKLIEEVQNYVRINF